MKRALRRLLPLALGLVIPACALPRLGDPPPVVIPPSPNRGLPLGEKAARLETWIGERYLHPWGTLRYRVAMPEGPDGPLRTWYMADTVIWTGVLLGTECERWAATRDPAALERARTLLHGLSVQNSVTGERGLWARYLHPRDSDEKEPKPEFWHDGGPGWEDWRWRGELSKDQIAGLVYGFAAVLDHLEDPWCRLRTTRLLGDLSDRLLGRGAVYEDIDGQPARFGDMRPRVAGLPVGVHAAVLLGLAEAASRASPEPRHRRRFERLVDEGVAEIARFATIRIFGKENWNNPNMTALGLASILRRDPGDDPRRVRARRGAERALRSILALHRGEGNAFWIAIAAPAGEAAGCTPRDLADARAQLATFPLDRRELELDLRGHPEISRSIWTSRKGLDQSSRPLPAHLISRGAFIWKSDPYELLQELPQGGNTVYAGVDFLAPYWMLRRQGRIDAGE